MRSNQLSTEKAILKPPPPAAAGEPAPKVDNGKRRVICGALHMLILARLTQAYQEAGLDVPRDFSKENYVMPASGIATHAEGELKKKCSVPEISTFASWRKEYEEQEAEELGGAGASRPPPAKKAKK